MATSSAVRMPSSSPRVVAAWLLALAKARPLRASGLTGARLAVAVAVGGAGGAVVGDAGPTAGAPVGAPGRTLLAHAARARRGARAGAVQEEAVRREVQHALPRRQFADPPLRAPGHRTAAGPCRRSLATSARSPGPPARSPAGPGTRFSSKPRQPSALIGRRSRSAAWGARVAPDAGAAAGADATAVRVPPKSRRRLPRAARAQRVRLQPDA